MLKKLLQMFSEELKKNHFESKLMTNQLMESLKLRSQKEGEILKNNEYANWLDNFLIKHPIFFSDGARLVMDNLSDEDKSNVSDLACFYNALYDYADYNHLNIEIDDYTTSMFIEYNGKQYELYASHVIGYGVRCTDDEFTKYIDLNEVISDLSILKKRIIKNKI